MLNRQIMVTTQTKELRRSKSFGASGRSTFLVATDVAARGLDIPKALQSI